MARPSSNRNRPPLDEEGLRALALHYLGRFATTRAKLRDYLIRKVKERGWTGDRPPDLDTLVGRMAALGYVDDRAFGAMKAASLARRGFGARRQDEALRAAGVGRDDAAAVREAAEGEPLEIALAFARRRRFGPFATTPADKDAQRKQVAAMIRAGHAPALAWRIVAAAPGEEVAREY